MVSTSVKEKILRKAKLLFPLVLAIATLGFISLLSSLDKPIEGKETLKPSVTTTLSSKKFNLVPTQSAILRIDGQVASAKELPKVHITSLGNDLLVLVNKSISLPAGYVPPDLVTLSGIPASPGSSLRAQAADALVQMFTEANAVGLNLTVLSAYRSYSQQVTTFNSWVSLAGLKAAESFSARPGHSQHQLGTAVDFGASGQSSFSQKFAETKEGAWVAANANRFGYVLSYPKGKEALTGYTYEPWHYRYIGLENTNKMLASGLILEAYLRKYGVW